MLGSLVTRPQQLNVQNRYLRGLQHGVKTGFEGSLLNLPFIGLEMATAEPGEKLAVGAGQLSEIPTYPIFAGAISAAAMSIPAFAATIPIVGIPVAVGLGLLLAIYPASKVDKGVTYGIKKLTEIGRLQGRLQMGGQYKDTYFAERLRQNALAELSYAQGPARRVLGSEAQFLHR